MSAAHPLQDEDPRLLNWEELRLTPELLPDYFTTATPLNVGIILGAPSGGLVDIDLDSREACALARTFLPPTPCAFGRPGKPMSHWLYQCEADPDVRDEKFRDVEGKDSDDRQMHVEFRATDGQTIFPGSVHESGERITFTFPTGDIPEPAQIGAADLKRSVVFLAVACILARHWPGEGTRQDAALATARVSPAPRCPGGDGRVHPPARSSKWPATGTTAPVAWTPCAGRRRSCARVSPSRAARG